MQFVVIFGSDHFSSTGVKNKKLSDAAFNVFIFWLNYAYVSFGSYECIDWFSSQA